MTASVSFYKEADTYYVILNGKRIFCDNKPDLKTRAFKWLKPKTKQVLAFNGLVMHNPPLRMAIICQAIVEHLGWSLDPEKEAKNLYETFAKKHLDNKPFTEIIDYGI
jgi:hypothetical protein